ncbi:MAG: substrate-binding domain-containing protein [Lachnospiraceae bacterium]|nr:substrate-binding domain-containing protein [Lachnospiraceae bacterium]
MKIFFIVFEAIIIIVLVLYLLMDWTRKKELMKQAELIKKRRMDLDDVEVSMNRRDSMASLASALNVIKNNMLTFLESTKNNVVILSDSIDVLSRGADLNREGSQRITESLASVVDKVEEQLELVKSCLDLIEDNTGKLTEIDGSMNEIGDLLTLTVESCQSGVASMENYENKMTTVSENLDRSEKILEEFNDKINEINEIGAFIVSISESLKMLALNASIEAARVGSAGSGFAVVAKEMGVMSAKTQQGIGTINGILDNIIESSDQVAECLQGCVEVFDEGRKEFDAVSASFRDIDRQAGVINEKTKIILTEIDEITKNSVVTKNRAAQAYYTSEEITSGTQEISQVSEQTSEVSQNIIDNAGNLNQMLSDLEQLLRQFTTAVEPVKKKAAKKIRIGVFCIDDNDFWHAVRRGTVYAKKELESHGAIVRYAYFPKWDVMTQEMPGMMERMMKEDFDGYVMPGFLVGTIDEQLEAEVAKGKKVYVINTDTSSTNLRQAIFQPDTAEAALLAAKLMINAIGKKGKVLIFEGSRELDQARIRSDVFQEYFENYNKIEIFTEMGALYPEEAYTQTTEYLKEHPDLTGIYVTTGNPEAVAKAVEDSGLKIKLVVYDHTQGIFQYIKKGIIVAAIGQDPFGQGHDPVIWMYNSLVTGEALPSEFMSCRSKIVDKTNVDNLLEV